MTNPQDLIGRVAVCHQGRVGIIERYEGGIFYGRHIHPPGQFGKPWQSKDPRPLPTAVFLVEKRRAFELPKGWSCRWGITFNRLGDPIDDDEIPGRYWEVDGIFLTEAEARGRMDELTEDPESPYDLTRFTTHIVGVHRAAKIKT